MLADKVDIITKKNYERCFRLLERVFEGVDLNQNQELKEEIEMFFLAIEVQNDPYLSSDSKEPYVILEANFRFTPALLLILSELCALEDTALAEKARNDYRRVMDYLESKKVKFGSES